jgi:hypothetical protein
MAEQALGRSSTMSRPYAVPCLDVNRSFEVQYASFETTGRNDLVVGNREFTARWWSVFKAHLVAPRWTTDLGSNLRLRLESGLGTMYVRIHLPRHRQYTVRNHAVCCDVGRLVRCYGVLLVIRSTTNQGSSMSKAHVVVARLTKSLGPTLRLCLCGTYESFSS